MLDHVRAFDAVVRTGSFAAAAVELHKAQSAVSYGVRQLEADLGVALFDRSGHRATLTDAGHALLQEGRRLLNASNRLRELASQYGQDYEPRLLIVIDGILPQRPLMRVLKQLATEHNPTQIEVRVEFLGGVQHRFERDDADIMIVKDFVPGPAYAASALPQIQSVLTCAPDHPLAQLDAPTLADLHAHVELSIHDSSEAPDVDPTMFGGSRVFYLSDFGAKRDALRLGLGFGWMPTYLADEDLSADELVEVRFVGGSRYSFAPQLVHRTTRPPGRTALRFIELVRSTLAESW